MSIIVTEIVGTGVCVSVQAGQEPIPTVGEYEVGLRAAREAAEGFPCEVQQTVYRVGAGPQSRRVVLTDEEPDPTGTSLGAVYRLSLDLVEFDSRSLTRLEEESRALGPLLARIDDLVPDDDCADLHVSVQVLAGGAVMDTLRGVAVRGCMLWDRTGPVPNVAWACAHGHHEPDGFDGGVSGCRHCGVVLPERYLVDHEYPACWHEIEESV